MQGFGGAQSLINPKALKIKRNFIKIKKAVLTEHKSGVQLIVNKKRR